MAKQGKNKRNKVPINIRKSKWGESYWYKLPTEFGRKWIRLGASWEGYTHKDAVRAYYSIKGDIAKRKFDIASGSTGAKFNEFTEAFIKDLESKKDDTSRERLYIKHFNAFFGEKTLGAITPPDVKEYIDKRLKKISPGTARKEYYFLRKVLKVAAKKEWRKVSKLDDNFTNPCTDLTVPPENPARHRVASNEELQKLLDQSPNPVIKAIVLFAINSGCRQSEILTLKESQVNWETGYIYWEKTKNKNPKNLPLSPALEKILKEVPRPKDSPYFFCSPMLEKPYTKSGIVPIFRRMRERAGLEDLRFHDMRRVFGTRLAEKGWREKDIAELLGHKDTRSTKVYVEVAETRKKEAMNSLDFDGLS